MPLYMRNKKDPATGTFSLHEGGTSATTAAAALSNLGGIAASDVGGQTGLVMLNAEGGLDGGLIASTASSLTLDGPAYIYAGSTYTFTISNYDSFVTYNVTADGGTVSRVGSQITYTAGVILGNKSITINERVVPLVILSAAPGTPTVTSPVAGSVDLNTSVSATSSAFEPHSAGETHVSSVWQVSTSATFVSSVVEATVTTGQLTLWSVTGLLNATAYYVRVRHTGSINGSSEWSAASSFTTKVYTIPNHEMAKLVASDKVANDYFGRSVAISDDGSRVVVGANLSDPSAVGDAGAAYIYLRSGTTWTQEAKISASDKAASDEFGWSVSMSSDGTRVVVGAHYADPDGLSQAGAAYIFLRTGTTWVQEAKISASDKAVEDVFGWSVAISSDGTRVVVGAIYSDPESIPGAGAAYVYLRTGTTWTQEAKLTASDKAADDYFGRSVSISSDGTRVVVGANLSDPSALSRAGATYIFLRTGTTWVQEAKLTANDKVANDYFGTSVSISSDGSRVVVGANQSDPSGVTDAGAAYIFSRSGTTWTQEAKISASDKAASDAFGWYVAISGDGSRVVVGSPYSNPGGTSDAGAAYIFLRTGTVWAQEAKISASDKAAGDWFGWSVAISSDGTRVVVGALYSDPSGITDVGAAYIYE